MKKPRSLETIVGPRASARLAKAFTVLERAGSKNMAVQAVERLAAAAAAAKAARSKHHHHSAKLS